MSKKSIDNFQLLLSGLDSLYVSYYLDTRGTRFDWDELHYQREKLRSERYAEFAPVELGSEHFALRPNGRNKYTFILVHSLFEVSLGENMRPSCLVKFSSEGLWSLGVAEVTRRFEAWYQSVGMLPTAPELVSRADWSFDYAIAAIDFGIEDFISRATKDCQYRDSGKVQTFSFGQSAVVIRVYDKAAEIFQKSGKVFFHELWKQEHGVWRIEFQVRRERMKQGGIKTLSDLAEFQYDLLREIAGNHTTLRRPSGDTNRSRWPLHPLWESLLQEIARMPQWGLIRSIDRRNSINYRINEQLKSIQGGLKGLSALLSIRDNGSTPLPLHDALDRLTSLLAPIHNPLIWTADLKKKIKAEEFGL